MDKLNVIDNRDNKDNKHSGSKYLYSNAKDFILRLIDGLKEGDRIPSRNKLMESIGVTRVTVDRAISELIGEGYLYAIDGSGTYIAEKKRENKVQECSVKAWGVIMDNIVSYGYPEIIRGIEDVASRNNINVIICNTDNDVMKQEMYINKLLDTGASGMIIVPAVSDEIVLEGFQKIQRNNIPFIFCVRSVEGITAPKVVSNNYYGESLATRHLLDIGRKRIAFISMPMYSVAEQRLHGYMAALAERGMEIRQELIIAQEGASHEKMGFEAVKKLLKLKNPPDGIVCHNDHIAYGAYQALREKGLTIPHDVALVGYDDSSICEIMPVKLTSVKYPKYETGEMAAQILMEMMNGKKDIQMINILSPVLKIRESSDSVKENYKL